MSNENDDTIDRVDVTIEFDCDDCDKERLLVLLNDGLVHGSQKALTALTAMILDIYSAEG